MDRDMLLALIGGGIAILLYKIEQRLASFENRLVMGVNAQTSLMREEATMIIEMDDGEEDEL